MDASTLVQALPGGVLEVRTHNRKGRSLHTTRHVKGGEVVLDEAPLLLLVAPEMAQSTCAACLRAVGQSERIGCPGSCQACYCSPACQQAAQATPWLHSEPICSAYSRLAALGLSAEDQGQLRFLMHALALRHAGTPEADQRFASLMGLVGDATEAERAVAARLAPALAEALQGVAAGGSSPALDVEALATLLRKEQLNSYGVLAAKQQVAEAATGAATAAAGVQQQGAAGEASGSGQATTTTSARGGAGGGGGCDEEVEDGERRLRGSALYAQASLINHECLPNVARFDFFDSGSPHGAATHVSFRALHDLPAGTELAQSYVPLHWSLGERQAQCREVYGFDCTCPRCQTESQWSDGEEGEEESEWETDSGGDGGDMEDDAAAEAGAAAGAGEAAAASGGGEDDAEVEMRDVQAPIVAPPGEEGPLEPTYLRLFLLKYMCAAPGCFGTAAPPAPGSPLLECNVCGRARSEREFLRELEKSQQQEQQRQRQRQQQQHQQQQQQQRQAGRRAGRG